MDFSERGSDGWGVLHTLCAKAAHSYKNRASDIQALTWALRSFGFDLKMNFDAHEFSRLVHEAGDVMQLEVIDLLLSISGKRIDAASAPGGYPPLHKILVQAPSFFSRRLSMYLRRGADPHLISTDFRYSSHSESPTSLSIYNPWVFNKWQRALRAAEVNIEEFVKQELRPGPLVDAGWETETLLTLFQYSFECDEGLRCRDCCNDCSRYMHIKVRPYWLQQIERFKRRLHPEVGSMLDSYTRDSCSSDNGINEAKSILSKVNDAANETVRNELMEK